MIQYRTVLIKLPSYPPDNHHSSDVDFHREEGYMHKKIVTEWSDRL